MAKELKFFICEHCKNIITKIKDSGVKVVCCGQPMTELVANTVDAATEKHIPVVSVDGKEITIKVGSVTHPMLEEHSIQWICLQTDKGTHFAYLNPGEAPEAKFALVDEKPIAAYEYCNLHGLWKAEI